MAERQQARVPLRSYGKPRPRLGRGKAYNPKAYDEWRRAFRNAFGAVTVTPPYRLRVVAAHRIPKGTPRRRAEGMDGAFRETAPDVDNLLGAVMDALFEDDRQVAAVYCEKRWSRGGDWLDVELEHIDMKSLMRELMEEWAWLNTYRSGIVRVPSGRWVKVATQEHVPEEDVVALQSSRYFANLPGMENALVLSHAGMQRWLNSPDELTGTCDRCGKARELTAMVNSEGWPSLFCLDCAARSALESLAQDAMKAYAREL